MTALTSIRRLDRELARTELGRAELLRGVREELSEEWSAIKTTAQLPEATFKPGAAQPPSASVRT